MQYYNSNLTDKEYFVDATGPWLIDNKGNRFFDSWLGSGTLIFGHEKIKHSNVIKMLPETSISNHEDISLINNLVDFEIGSFGIQTSGSSAITRACRIARAVTNRRLIALIGDFWHGSEDEFLFRHNYELLSDGLSISPGQNYVWFKTLESFIAQKNFQEFAAILIEPVQGSNPEVNIIKGTDATLTKLTTAVKDIDKATSPFANFVSTFDVTPPGAAAIIIKPSASSIGT